MNQEKAEEALETIQNEATELIEIADNIQIEKINEEGWNEKIEQMIDKFQELKEGEVKFYAGVLDERSGKGRIREYFNKNKGKTLTSEHIARVAGIKEFARRIRELRNEEGFVIDSTRTRGDLGSHEYEFIEKRAVDTKKRISSKTRWAQIQRQPVCEECGYDPREHGEENGDTRFLEVDHIEAYVYSNNPECVNDSKNLRTLCNVCHKGRSAFDGISNKRGKS